MKVGTRVGAIRSIDDDTAYLFGYGVYEGKHLLLLVGTEIRNPRIKLDNGKVVWGCECWWGPEQQIRDRIDGLKVVMVDPPEQEEYGE